MIEVISISKNFDNIKAVQQISFNVKKGQIFGFLGPNGAGKSTTINMLNTLLEPDQGSIMIDGTDLSTDADQCKLKIGVVPQEIALYDDLSALENLKFWGGLYQIPKNELKERAEWAIRIVGLEDRKKDAVKTYSGGMKRRVNIAAAILHKPKILLLDEPTVGVDPQSRNHIFETIEQLNKEGMTIIYTTHYMEEAERLCDEIAIIDLGKIIATGDLEELRKISGVKDKLIIHTSEKKQIEYECESIGSEISGILENHKSNGNEILSIDTHKANLESIFLKLTGKQLRD